MPQDSTLFDAFSATRYRVVARDCVIRIGEPMPKALSPWLPEDMPRQALWLITADNPGAQQITHTINTSRRAVLDALLDRPGLRVCQTVHEDPADAWPDERGRLIAGLEAGQACALGRRFGQAAVVTLSKRLPARLVWLDNG